MNLYENQFDPTHDHERVDAPQKTLVIASTPRCGSHMLGHALMVTGQFGSPFEYANPYNLKRWRETLGIQDNLSAVREIMRRRTGSNGVFGIKVHYGHIKTFGSFRGLLDVLPNPYFVLLSRSNVVEQAISYAIAKRTGVWIDGQEAEDDIPPYEFDEVERCLTQLLEEGAGWRYTLATHGVQWIEMDFDSIRNDIRGAEHRIAAFADIPIPPEAPTASLVTRCQKKAANSEWRDRFLADIGGRPWSLHRRYRAAVTQAVKRRLGLRV